MKRLRYQSGSLDGIDTAILEHLIADSRTSVAELARRVSLSAPSVAERIKRLEEEGIIKGYTLEISPVAIGLPLTVWLRIRPLPGKLKHVAEILRAHRQIVECDRITGDDCYIARAHVAGVGDLEALIDRFAEFAATHTSLVQSSPVERRLPPIKGNADISIRA